MSTRKPETGASKGRPAVDLADSEARVHVELAALTSFLEAKAISGADYGEIREQLEEKRKASLERRLDELRGVSLPAWLYVRNPVWGTWFQLRRWISSMQEPSWDLVHKLDRWLGRAQFSRGLSSHAREQLRRLIRNQDVSRWEALSLVRSTGCTLRKDGRLEVNTIGPTGLMVGSVACCFLGGLFLLTVQHIGVQLVNDCPSLCVVQGLVIISHWMAMFFVLCFSVTWGRHRSAKRLHEFLGGTASPDGA